MMLEWLAAHTGGLAAVGAAITFIWSVAAFIDVRRRDQRVREFDAFHRLIKEIVAPDEHSGATWLDRQVAAVFELRHFPRYYDVTWRILSGLRENWNQGANSRLLREIDFTLDYLFSAEA